MARPTKKGLDYFPFDTDFFFSDTKIKVLKARFGADGLIIYIHLLCEIYREEGYFLELNDDTVFIIADELSMSAEKVKQVLEYLFSRSLLVKITSILSKSVTIITSAGIQKRYQKAVEERGRKKPVVIDKYWILSPEETAAWIKVSQNNDCSENNDSNSENNDSNSAEKVHKEKKSKVKESKAVVVEGAAHARGKTVFQSYMENINPTPSTSIVDAVNSWIEDGVEEEMMILAIEDAAANNARNWKYVNAIIKNCVNDGVRTAEQYRARQEQWSRRNKSKHEDAIGNFTQRKYSNEELDSLVYVPGMEVTNETNT